MAYKFRIYPTEDQKNFLEKSFGCVRWVYNWALSNRIEWWSENKDIPKDQRKKCSSVYDLNKQIALLKKREDTKWLNEVYSQSLENAVANLDNAFNHFFRRIKLGNTPGYPRFKCKFKSINSVQFRKGVKIDNELSTVFIPKCGWTSIILHRSFEGIIRTCTVSKTPTEKYFISILVDDNKSLPDKKIIKNSKKTIGIDWGVKTFATISNGEEIENPLILKKWKKILTKEQRTLARRKPEKGQEPSKNYLKQKLLVAKLHEKIKNIRREFLHKQSHDLIQRFDTICIEDLNVAGMTRSSKGSIENPGKNVAQKSGLNKAILDTSPGEFFRQLEYKAEWNGKNILKADRFYASSKTCECDKKNTYLTLSDRTWICECGKVNERDLNAAANIRKHCLDKVL